MDPGVSWRRVGLGPRPRRRSRLRLWLRLRLRSLACLALALFLLGWLVLPYDNTVRLAFRFNFKRLRAAWASRPSERWVFAAQPEFPVDLGRDVLVILKTGYGTRERVPAWLHSLGDTSEFRDILVIADYASQPGDHFSFRDQQLPVHDMVRQSLAHPTLSARQSHPRVLKYGQLAEAVAHGNDELGRELSKSFGWELDALKVGCSQSHLLSLALVPHMPRVLTNLPRPAVHIGARVCLREVPQQALVPPGGR